MIFHLEIENFYSVRDRQAVDLRVPADASVSPGYFAPLWRGATERAPRVVAIFGPNAAGKSNVLRALKFVAWFAGASFGLSPTAALPYQRFNSQEANGASTFLAVSLAGLVDPTPESPNLDECRYDYELTLGGPAGESPRVLAEAMYYWPDPRRGRVRLFNRDDDGKVTAAKAFRLNGYRSVLEKVLRPNASVISTLAQINHPFATAIARAANEVLSNIFIVRDDGDENWAVRLYAANPGLVDALNREIERIDLGIRAVRLEQGPSGPVALFTHEGHDEPMDLLFESHGTKTFFKLFPLLLGALDVGGVALVDELDAAIHPLILPEILRWFRDPGRNPQGAQLWMTCQNASLLEELVPEEVLFCAKSASGRSEVYGLRDIDAVGRDDDHYRKYMGGVYGAVPHIG